MFSRRTLAEEDGQAAAELAVVLMPLLLILLAILQFGILFRDYLALTDAVRASARTAAVSRNAASPEGTARAAFAAAAEDIDGATVVFSTSWEPATPVEVEGRAPFKISLLGLVVKEGELVSTTTERVE